MSDHNVMGSGRAATVKTFQWRIWCDGSMSFPRGTRCHLQTRVDGGEWINQHADFRTKRECSDTLERITQGRRRLRLAGKPGEGK